MRDMSVSVECLLKETNKQTKKQRKKETQRKTQSIFSVDVLV